ncbi:MAG: 30S ribosomal protein S7 [Proteobacteria bacterium]|nr:30S ribosomal protein S7 [Pseudomonadota bacterium]
MSRKKRDYKRHVQVDPRFGDQVVGKAINIIMDSGKKATAEKALYLALDQIAKKTGADAIEGFHKALNNMKPSVEVRSRRVGGATYQIPTEVRAERAQSLALRWLKEAAAGRSERTLADRLANELLDATQNRGAAVKKREDSHRMADANKAFAHFKW